MRRFAIAVLLALLMMALYVVGAEATSGAHFFSDTSASVTSTGALSVFIDEAGVGQATVDYTINWTGTADYGCINGGGNHPQASNKETVSSGGAAHASFSPINGRVMATFPVPGTPPPSPSSFSCPSGQTLVLADVSYTVTITDNTNGVTSKILTASATFFTFKK